MKDKENQFSTVFNLTLILRSIGALEITKMGTVSKKIAFMAKVYYSHFVLYQGRNLLLLPKTH